MDGFAAIAEPTRRALVDVVRASGSSDVGGLVAALGVSQPLVSKHLKVLRDAGVLEVEVDGRRRVSRLAADPLPEVLAWVAPFVTDWNRSLDRLEQALDADRPVHLTHPPHEQES